MGRVLTALEGRDRELRAQPPAAFQGTGSLHASLISGGRELSSYPDRCTLEMERRTVATEDSDTVLREVNTILERLRRDDPEFRAEARLVTYRPAHRLAADHPLTGAVAASLARAGRSATPMGMSFWTDAAILSAASTARRSTSRSTTCMRAATFWWTWRERGWNDLGSRLRGNDACSRLVNSRRHFQAKRLPRSFHRSRIRLFNTKFAFAGRSPSRRMKYGNHSRPNGT
jgi:hypothetical protein